MLFSTPLAALLVAAGVAAVPVIIHLLNRKRFHIVPWAAMRFLLAAQKRNLRRLRLEQWLLLATRIGIMLLLAAALASVTPWAEGLWQRWLPAGIAAPPAAGRTHRIIVLDGSFSMGGKRDGRTAFEHARLMAERILRDSSPGDGISLVLMARPAQVLVRNRPFDLDRLLPVLLSPELRLPHDDADLADTLDHVSKLLAVRSSRYAQREVYFLTDLQKATWPLGLAKSANNPAAEPRAAELFRQIADQAHVVFVDVGRPDLENAAVSDIALADRLAVVGADSQVAVTVRYFGPVPSRSVGVELLVGKARVGAGDSPCSLASLGKKFVTLSPGGRDTVTFSVRFDTPGEYVLQGRLDADGNDIDNTRSLVVPVRDKALTAWLVHQRPEDVEQLATLLNPNWRPGGEGRFTSQDLVRPVEVTESQFAGAVKGEPAPTDCVFVCNVPRLSERSLNRLEAHLAAGGSVIFCMGPQVNRAAWNGQRFQNGQPLLPVTLQNQIVTPEEAPYRLTASDDSFRRPPLTDFVENFRASLLNLPFRNYARVEVPTDSPARTVLALQPPARPGAAPSADVPHDPFLLAWRAMRGQAVLIASYLNADGTARVFPPTFAVLVHETLRLLAFGRPQSLPVGDPLELTLPPNLAGRDVTVTRLEGGALSGRAPRTVGHEGAALVRIPRTDQSGVFKLTVAGQPREYLFAVNVPMSGPDARLESNPARTDASALERAANGGSVQVVTELGQVKHLPPTAHSDEAVQAAETVPVSRGPVVARWLLLALVALLAMEVILAWRFGSARSAPIPGVDPTAAPRRDPLVKGLLWTLAHWPLLAVLAVAGVLAHAAVTGTLLSFLPTSARHTVETLLGVPPAPPGEETAWRLQYLSYLTGDRDTDRWLILALAVALTLGVLAVYFGERRGLRATGGQRRVWPLAGLRLGLLFLALAVFLPQLQLTFDRQEWPDVALVFDDSASMAVENDAWPDPQAHAQAEALHKLGARSRLQLAQALAAGRANDWLTRLLNERRVKAHVYRVSNKTESVAEVTLLEQAATAAARVRALKAIGPASKLGDGLRTVLNEFRGGSLGAVVMFTDGASTDSPAGDNEDLRLAADLARRRGVPLYFVGLGDPRPPRELQLELGELPDVVLLKDRIVFAGRITGQGDELPARVDVVLYEKIGDQRKELKRESVALGRPGAPVPFRLTFAPDTPGDKAFVLVIDPGPPPPGQRPITTTPIERTVNVADIQQIRVLYVEGRPRYEFRFVKTLLERELARDKAAKSVALRTLLLDADKGFEKVDESELADFPTPPELFGFNVVILGDVNPAQLGIERMKLLVEFVRRGGGLLFVAGEEHNPRAYRDTPLAAVLPLTWDVEAPTSDSDGGLDADGYQMRLTVEGKESPLFRFAQDDAQNQAIWERLKPFFWSARGYGKARTATVLATHPTLPALREKGAVTPPSGLHPLVLRQLVGGGRVLFFGFDETWRWRWRDEEPYFNQFWYQTVRYLALSQLKRPKLKLDRTKPYRRGATVRLTAAFPDGAPPPAGPVQVRIDRTPPKASGQPPAAAQLVTLGRPNGSSRAYEYNLPGVAEGEYTFTLVAPAVTPSPPKVSCTVLPPVGELDRVQMNESGLREAASESHGKFYTLADAARLIDELPEFEPVTLDQPCPPWRLWDHPALFTLALALVWTEWVARKRRRML